jgi:hypothetical protein
MKSLFFGLCLLMTTTIFAQSTTVVISQVYGGGGSISGIYQSDFVELHNISATSQDISGYKIMYGSATGALGSSGTNVFTFPSNTIIPAGGYLLVATAPAQGLSPLPITADFTFTLGIGSANGKVAFGTAAMTNNTTYTAQPAGAVIDFVGYGTAGESESAALAPLTTITAAIRKNNGCTETNNNSTDFEVATPNPRNSTSPAVSCSVVTTPLLSVISTLPSFGNVCVNSIAGPKAFSISGSNLTAGAISVGPLNGYTFSTDTTAAFNTTLSLNQSGGSYTATIYVKFSPVVVQSYNGNIPVSGGGASTSQSAVGNGIATATIGNAATTNITSSGATLNGTLVEGCESTLSYGFVYSTVSGFVPATGTSAPSSNLSGTNFSVSLSGLLPSTTYYFYAFTTTASGIVYAATEGTFTTTLASSGGQGVVISQIYGGGGSPTATFNVDYIEIHNNTAIAQNIGGCKIMYGSSAGNLGSTTSNVFTFPTNTIIPSGAYLLIASSPSTGLAPLPIPADYSMTINMAASNGKVVFGSSSMINNVLLASQPAGSVFDFVGYGTANESETATATGINATNAGFRKNNGCDDTNNNLNDFEIASPNPRNSASPIQICSTLPVQLVRFDVLRSSENTVQISWVTSLETDLHSFEIERSTDGRKWQSLHQIRLQGNSYSTKSYQWTDVRPTQGVNYYRLRTLNLDQTAEYSVVRKVLINGKQIVNVFPNPVKDRLQIQLLNTRSETTNIELLNMQGARVMQTRINESSFSLPVNNLARGLYQLRITRNGLTETQKILLQ